MGTTMKLYLSGTSPFARKCNMLVHLAGLVDHVEFVLTNSLQDEHFRQVNPLGKVPALVDGDLTLFDSPLICEYLDAKSVELGGKSLFEKGKPQYFKVATEHARANGIIDAAVSTVMESRRETEHSQFWLDRWQASIKTAIETFDISSLAGSASPNVATVATVAALAYLDFRLPVLPWREWNPGLADWSVDLLEQPWVIATQPS